MDRDYSEITDKDFHAMVKNSTTGTKQKAQPSKYIRVHKGRCKKALIGLCITCSVFGAVAFQGVKTIANRISDNFEVYEASAEFKKEAIYDNTHRTMDGEHYWYDYYKIADHVKTDEDVYLLYRNLGEYQSNKVLEHVDGIDSIQDYVDSHNYKSIEDWKDTAYKQILLENDIKNKQTELAQMQEEYGQQTSPVQYADQNKDLGGK